jgi:hypothetical protein
MLKRLLAGNKTVSLISAVMVVAMANCAFAQKKAAPSPAAPSFNEAATRQQAEAGNILAQLTLANHLAASQRPADAMAWYCKAAAKQQVEAYYQLGNILLFGATATDAAQAVAADPVAGVRWTFRAATNQYARACLNMSRALEHGLGVKTNLVEACAWMQLYAEREPVAGRPELTNLIARLDPISIQEGQKLAVSLKARQWTKLAMLKVEQLASGLRLEGVTMGGRSPLAVINHRTLAQGETTEVPVNGETLEVKCLEIREASVLIEIEGDGEPRLMRFGEGLAAQAGR